MKKAVIKTEYGPPWCYQLTLECGHRVIYRRKGIHGSPKKVKCDQCAAIAKAEGRA